MAKKIKEPAYKSWEDVENALKLIAELDQRVVEANNVMNKRIDRIKEETLRDISPLIKQRLQLEEAVEEFTKYRKADFIDKKTRTFTFGEVGFRKTTNIVTRNVKAIIEALKQNKMQDCIDTKESINKDKLADYDDKALETVGAKRKTKDNYFYNIYTERIEE
jgi:phage host-nuclease inhibitor protein Gam